MNTSLLVARLEGGSHGVEYGPHVGVVALAVLPGDGASVVPPVISHKLLAVEFARVGQKPGRRSRRRLDSVLASKVLTTIVAMQGIVVQMKIT